MKTTIYLTAEDFNLEKTLECGQYFRYKKNEDGSYSGVVLDEEVVLSQLDNILIVEGNVSKENLSHFFTLDVNYEKINESISQNETLKSILDYSSGIHILRQPLFESLISFIISQNNNIKRITGIIESLCNTYGERISNDYYSFPKPSTLAVLTQKDLAPLRMGFRDRYVIDAAKRWESGDINQKIVREAPLKEARAELMKIYGVGPKVTDCTLLYGASRLDAFPEDVWIKRAMLALFPNGLPLYTKEYAGIVQQYIFYYARNNPLIV